MICIVRLQMRNLTKVRIFLEEFRFETDKQYCLVKLFFSNNCNVIKSKCFFIKGTKLISLQGLHFKKLQFSTLGNTDLFYLSKKRPPNNNFILWPKINLSCLHLSFSIYLMDANQFQEEVKILHFLHFDSNNEGLWFRVFKWLRALFKLVKVYIIKNYFAQKIVKP